MRNPFILLYVRRQNFAKWKNLRALWEYSSFSLQPLPMFEAFPKRIRLFYAKQQLFVLEKIHKTFSSSIGTLSSYKFPRPEFSGSNFLDVCWRGGMWDVQNKTKTKSCTSHSNSIQNCNMLILIYLLRVPDSAKTEISLTLIIKWIMIKSIQQ